MFSVLKKLIVPILLLIGVVIFSNHTTDFQTLFQAITDGSPLLIILCIGVATIAIIFQAEAFKSLYDFYGIKEALHELIVVTLGMNCANLLVPTVGFSGVTLFVANARAKHISSMKALSVALLYYVLYFYSFSLLLLFGVIFIAFYGIVSPYEIATIIVFLIVVAAGSLFLRNIGASKEQSLKITAMLVAFINKPYRWLKQQDILQSTDVQEVAFDLHTNLKLALAHKSKLFIPFVISLFAHLSAVLLLGLSFLAFQETVPLTLIIVAYSFSVVFTLISITPSGIGFVEGIMIVTFRSFGIAPETAILVTFFYRGLTFWLPFFIGLGLVKRLHLVQTINE